MPNLFIDVEGRFAKFQDALDSVHNQTRKTADSMAKAFGSVNAALASIGVGVSVAGFVALAKSAIEVQDHLLDMAQATGASVGQLDQMRQVAQLAGANFDDVGQAMARLARNMSSSGDEAQTASGALKFLGISAKDSEGNFRGVGDVMTDIAKKLDTYKDGAGKTALVQDLLGKNSAALIPYLRALAEAGERNSIISKESAEAAHKFEVSLRDLKIASEQAGISIANDLTGPLTSLLKTFNALRSAGGWKALVFGSGTDTEDPLGEARKLSDSLAIMKTQRDELAAMSPFKRWFSTDDIKILDVQIEATAKKIGVLRDFFNLRNREALTSPMGDPNADEKKKDPNYNRKVPKVGTDEHARLYTTTLQRLNLEYLKLNGFTEIQKIRYEAEEGTLKILTGREVAHLEVIARKIDKWREEEIARAENTKGWDVYAANIGTAKAALDSFNETQRLDQDALKFSLDLIGKTAKEQGLLNVLRKIELDRRREAASIPDGQIGKALELSAAFEKAEKKSAEFYDAVYEKSRLAFTGALGAVDDYINAATNSAAQTKTLLTDAFKGAEDALVNFVKTGKLSFTAFADTVITQLIRIQVQRSFVEPISKLLNFGGLFGGGEAPVQLGLAVPRAAGGPVYGGSSYLVGEKGPEIFTPSTAGKIIPSGAWGGGDMDFHFNFAGGQPTDPQAFLAAVVPIIKSVARREIGNQLRNGGVLQGAQ